MIFPQDLEKKNKSDTIYSIRKRTVQKISAEWKAMNSRIGVFV